MSHWKPLTPPIAEYLDCPEEEQNLILAEIAKILYKMADQFEKRSIESEKVQDAIDSSSLSPIPDNSLPFSDYLKSVP